MLFNSLHFLVFFPIVVCVYFLLPQRVRWAFLLVSSYYFYMAWRPEYAILMFISTVLDFSAGYLLDKTDDPGRRKQILVACLTGNLGLLFYFKYFNFAASIVQDVSNAVGIPAHFAIAEVVLPVGISFYTFQSMSYTIDVYRKQQPAILHFGKFAAFVSFFPQLLAGPIERAAHLFPQFEVRHRIDMERMRDGLLLMAVGFFKKLVIADRLAIYVNEVYGHPSDYTGVPFVIAAYAFAFQVYADFSGYSDIARGAAKVLGFDLMINFDRPFHSQSMSEVWQRWNISLSTWFRDYLYIPLGGSRVSRLRHYSNLIFVFSVSGLWHGASANRVAWGAINGLYLVIGVITRPFRDKLVARVVPNAMKPLHTFLKVIIVFHLFVISLVIFRAHTIDDAVLLVTGTVLGFNLDSAAIFKPLPASELLIALGAIVALEIAHLAMRRQPLLPRVTALPLPVRWASYALLIFAVIILGTFSKREFFYFQF